MKKLFVPAILIVLVTFFYSCGPARVEPGFNVTIKGKVVDQSGNPVTGVTAELWKSDLNLLDSDLIFYSTVAKGKPFKTTKTSSDGTFQFSLTATEANNSSNTAAAFFVVSVAYNNVRVSTYSHYFSDKNIKDLTWNIENPPMKLWSGGEITTSTDGKTINVSWEKAPDKGTFSFLIYKYWYQQGIDSPFVLPTFVLDRNISINNYTARILLRGLNYRYATLKSTIKASNKYSLIPIKCDSRGVCGGYYVPNQGDMVPISKAITDGKYDYFDLNGKFIFHQRPVEIYIPLNTYSGETTLNTVVLHGLDIKNWEGQKLEIYVTTDSNDLSTLKAASWKKVGEITLNGNKYYYLTNLHAKATGVKFTLTGNAQFAAVCEISFFH